MIDFMVIRPEKRGYPFSYDVHKADGTCTSGYQHEPEYDCMFSAVRSYMMGSGFEWCSIDEWGGGYTPIGSIDLFRWEDDQEV